MPSAAVLMDSATSKREGFDHYDAGTIDAFELDHLIHHYQAGRAEAVEHVFRGRRAGRADREDAGVAVPSR
jgi:hypothetical protein